MDHTLDAYMKKMADINAAIKSWGMEGAEDYREEGEVSEDSELEDPVEEEFFAQSLEYGPGWYREHDDPTYEFDPYNPEGRFYTNPMLLREEPLLARRIDWYHRNGIPHEVSTPDGRWMCFRLWMLHVARGWWGVINRPAPHTALFGDIYGRVNVNFFQVMRSRIDRQVKYAFWTHYAHRRQREVLTWTPNLNRHQFREEMIMYSLTGMDGHLALRPRSVETESLRQFICYPEFREIWIEYAECYLEHHPDTTNPMWNQLQAVLANPNIAIYRTRAYGTGLQEDRLRLNKTTWSHEDHAMRFIISLYRFGRLLLIRNGVGPNSGMNGWRSYFFKQGNSPDVDDRYWFGFSLLMLLTSSWQHAMEHPDPFIGSRLIPALWPDFNPQPMEFPEINVGMVNLSPRIPWVLYPDYNSPVDFHYLTGQGVTMPEEENEMWERESQTELGDNGNRLPDHPPRELAFL